MQHTDKLVHGNKRFFYAWFEALHTRADLFFYTKAQSNELLSAANEIEKELLRIGLFANRFNPESELSHVNRTAFDKETVVSGELFTIVADCIFHHQRTKGYFDITIHSENGFREGIETLILDPNHQTIRFSHPDVRLDLSGYIKGYALRSVIKIIERHQIKNALINLGNSSIFAKGNHPHGEGWKIKTNDERSEKEWTLKDECLTTSGNHQATKWPIINPLTGEKAETGQTVSVLTKDPVDGEVLSKVACVARPEECEAIMKKYEAAFC